MKHIYISLQGVNGHACTGTRLIRCSVKLLRLCGKYEQRRPGSGCAVAYAQDMMEPRILLDNLGSTELFECTQISQSR